MANRIGTFPTFANLAPPWALSTLDGNFISVNTFANDSSLGFVNGINADTGTPNNYIVSCPFGAPTAYNKGMTLAFTPANSNTGASTITVSPLGSVAILTSNGNPLPAGAIQAGNTVLLILIGTSFRIFSSTYNPLNQTPLITAPGTTSFNCSGISALQVFSNMVGAGAGNFIFSMTNLAAGVVVDFTLLVSGAGQHISMNATNPAAATYSVFTVYGFGSALFNMVSGHDSATTVLVYHGVTFVDPTTSNPVLYLGASQF